LRTLYPVTQHNIADDFSHPEQYYENLKSRPKKKVLVVLVLRCNKSDLISLMSCCIHCDSEAC